ncbi:basic proline-rich protein-like [Leucoraja erinacea]|uniref:basic proline-rich protein-like n=1 Tax=Leucoraja erinaceus TaxID=7782 RepID=UPI002457FB99|nr:basic proline-rich protein-like [Leucoraja erinacea]
MMVADGSVRTTANIIHHPHDLVLVAVAILTFLLVIQALPCVTGRWRRQKEKSPCRAPGLAISAPRPPPPLAATTATSGLPRGVEDQPPTLWLSPLTTAVPAADWGPCPPNPRPNASKGHLPLPLAPPPFAPTLAQSPAMVTVHLGCPGDRPSAERRVTEGGLQDRSLRGDWPCRAPLLEGAWTSKMPPELAMPGARWDDGPLSWTWLDVPAGGARTPLDPRPMPSLTAGPMGWLKKSVLGLSAGVKGRDRAGGHSHLSSPRLPGRSRGRDRPPATPPPTPPPNPTRWLCGNRPGRDPPSPAEGPGVSRPVGVLEDPPQLHPGLLASTGRKRRNVPALVPGPWPGGPSPASDHLPLEPPK